MSLINVADLTFGYEGSFTNIFEQVSFQVDTDWRLGFIGRNGRGKTTFLKLLLGEYPCGNAIAASVPFDYFPFEVADDSQSALETAAAMTPDTPQWQLKRELSLLEVGEDALYRAFDTLSSGERTKVLLAALFCREGHFLLIDEPTNHLDQHARTVLGDYLAAKRGFILVSHDRAFLDRCVDHVLALNKTNIEVQRGNFSSWMHNKELRDHFEVNENERLKREVRKLSAAAKRSASWSEQTEQGKYGTRNSGLRVDRGFVGHKAAKMMKRAKNIDARRQEAAEEKSKLLRDLESAEPLAVHPLVYRGGRLAEAVELTVSYGAGPVCLPVGFTVENGDRVGLAGRNGCGKSSLLKLLGGAALSYEGILRLGSGLIVSVVPQETDGLTGGLSAFAEDCGIDESLFKAILRKLDFSREQFEKDLADFSAGQRKKVCIARSLCQRAHLYLWDEPLNYIDVFSRLQIEALLLQCRPTLVFVEHDSAFFARIATKIVEIFPAF